MRSSSRARLRALLSSLALAWLAGCGTLPAFVPDLARRPMPQAQVAGARGPLSAAESKAVLDRLRAAGGGSDVLERHLALEEAISGSPLVAGNEVKLLMDGPATYAAMLGAIAAAKDHVNMETYIFDDDEVGERFAQALVAKQRAGVQVNLIHDGVGTLRTPKAFFERLSASGVRLLEFNPVNPANAINGWRVNRRDHRKLLIVDGEVTFLGGINISGVYSSGSSGGSSGSSGSGSGSKAAGPAPEAGWRDTDLELRGPVVAEFQKLFLDTWAKQGGDPLPRRDYFPPQAPRGKAVVRAIGSAPEDPFSLIYVTLLSAIANAETSIRITNAYFAPDPQFLAALADAARRGVDVQLILPSKTDSWLVFHAGRRHYEPLLEAGVKIHERRDAILHSKTALIDGVWATVGSTNLDWRSFLHNQEVNAVVLDAAFADQLRRMFERDLEASDRITLDRWRSRGLDLRVKEWFTGIWEYWL